MTRRLLTLPILIALPLFTAGTAFGQEPMPTPPPAAPVTPPLHAQPAPPPIAAPNAAAGSPVPGPASGELEARRVPTSVESGPENAVLERRVATETSTGRILFIIPIVAKSEKWEQVCVAPCRVDLDRYSSYRVAKENDMPSTEEFTLPPGAQALRLQVEPGNLLVHRIGKQLITIGTAAAIVGGALITTASKFHDEKDVRVGGIITAGAGLLFLGVGIPLAIVSQTHVKSDDRKLANSGAKRNGPILTPTGLVF